MAIAKLLPMRGAAVVLLSTLLLAACGGKDDAPATQAEQPAAKAPTEAAEKTTMHPLEDTSWQLVEFQSMDDSQGTTKVDDPSKYTMELKADGSVAMQLNCNRATGTWSAQPGADGTSGSFEFGPLAMTRAFCPPPSMDEQIASQSEYIRSYLLRDGNLYLSLMADGGIYVWEPVAGPVAFESKADAEIEAAIRAASPDYTKEAVDTGSGMARYVYSRLDLNGDGFDELFAYPLGSYFCGTGGCSLLLFKGGADGYTLVNNFSITRTPVIVAAEKSNGWNDIWRLRSGGGAPPEYVANRFDGEKYEEAESIAADQAPAGTPVLNGDFTFNDGIPLQPRS